MSHPALEEWAALSAAWRSAPADSRISLDILLRRERRRRLLMTLLVLVEVLISLAGLTGAMVAARRMPAPGGAILVAGVVVYIAVIGAFSWWNRRGTWRPLAETTEAFLAISVLRCRRGLRSVRFVIGVVMVQLLAMLLWSVAQPSRAAGEGLLLSAALGTGFLLWALWYRRLMLRRLGWLDQLMD